MTSIFEPFIREAVHDHQAAARDAVEHNNMSGVDWILTKAFQNTPLAHTNYSRNWKNNRLGEAMEIICDEWENRHDSPERRGTQGLENIIEESRI